MPISLGQTSRAAILDKVNSHYPGWQGFQDPRFAGEEVAYKRVASEQALQLLGQDELARLLQAGAYGEIIERLLAVGRMTNLLYLSIPQSSDLSVLFRKDLDQAAFCLAMFNLLWGDGASAQRLDSFFNFCSAQGLKNRWTFATYFLFLCHPATEMFIKPEGVIKPFLKFIGSDYVFPSQPGPVAYQSILDLAQEIKRLLADFQPRDMIDIQSIMWLCVQSAGHPQLEFEIHSRESEIPPISNETRFWKISPGADAHLWNYCRRQGLIAIGWPEMGDVRDMPREEFNNRRAELELEDNWYTPDRVEQVWKFTHDIKPGDRIVANKGTKQVLGIGVVTGEPEYVPDVHYRIRLPVRWHDTTPRAVTKGGWVSTLQKLTRNDFDSLVATLAVPPARYYKCAPYEEHWDWDTCLKEKCLLLGYDALGDVSPLHTDDFDWKRDELIAAAKLNGSTFQPADVEAVWTLSRLLRGDQIVAVERKTGRVLATGEVTGEYYFDEAVPKFKHRVPVEWKSVPAGQQDPAKKQKTLQPIDETEFDSITGQLSRPVPPPVPPLLMSNEPLNQVLYGPPGTGKTFGTIQRAIRIITGNDLPEQDAKREFDGFVKNGRIKFVTFHQSYSYEDFVEGIRPIFDDSADGQARYECRDGILKDIALEALGMCLEPAHPGEVTFDDVWEKFREKVEEEPEWLLPGMKASEYAISFTKAGNIRGTNTLGRAKEPYNASVHNIRKIWERVREQPRASSTLINQILGKHSHSNLIGAVVEELKRLQPEVPPSPETFTPREAAESFLAGSDDYRFTSSPYPAYVVIIDEINRGNMAKILGELITLLEPDKRLGNPMGLTVALPYSGDSFALPPNLYVIGTMNTADKSLALVDVALRRRFKFKELAPSFEVCNLKPEFRQVMEKLNKRITLRKDREHRIGHAYFMNVGTEETNFNEVFNLSIIPLLQEYFYNDWAGLRFVLGETKEEGKFIRRMPNSESAEARNKWQWAFDDGSVDQENLPSIAWLSDNYGLANSDAG